MRAAGFSPPRQARRSGYTPPVAARSSGSARVRIFFSVTQRAFFSLLERELSQALCSQRLTDGAHIAAVHLACAVKPGPLFAGVARQRTSKIPGVGQASCQNENACSRVLRLEWARLATSGPGLCTFGQAWYFYEHMRYVNGGDAAAAT